MSTSRVVPASLRGYRYAPRTVGFQGVRARGRWQVKGTVITVRGTAAHFEEIVEGAWRETDRVLAAVADDGRDAGIAHMLLHLGTGGAWLLVDWWSEGDILMHRHFHAGFDRPERFSDVAPRHFGPCVWELAVQAHERDAWIRHVLANPAGPDLAAYLSDGLNGAF